VRGRDGSDDRQAEAAATGHRRICGSFAAGEALEDLFAQLDWDAGPVVGDLDHRVAAVGKQPHWMASDGKTVWVTNEGSNDVSIVDLASGKVVKQERVGQPDSYFASPVEGDGKLYLASQGGVLTVVKAEPDFKELSSHALDGEEVWGTPAIAGHAVYVRSKEALYCFEKAD